MKKFGFIIIVIIGALFFFLMSDEEEEQYHENTSDDIYTLMIYMCGSDLESELGAATTDIAEMLSAKIDKKVNVILETGGASYWQDYDISSTNNQLYQVKSDNLEFIQNVEEKRDMTDPKNLRDFIEFVKKNYPADKYGLILWDHGGGAISGFGYDENADDVEDTLTIDEIKKVIDESGIDFEFIGFDACLMANFETAYGLKNHAKYLVASEESEPGTGWEYKSLLSKLSSNSSMTGEELGKNIVDNFIKENNSLISLEEATLSVIDLSKMDKLYDKVVAFAKEIKSEQLDTNHFSTISKAVSKTKSFADGEIDTIDLMNFAQIVDNSNSKELINSIKEAVIYSKNTDMIENANGMSLYWPYTDLDYYDQMLSIYENIGIGDDYTDVLTKFINFVAGGKRDSYTINSQKYDYDENYSDYNWYDEEFINDNEEYFDNYSSNEELEVTKIGDNYVLELSDDDWENINSITCEVMLDDGESGYIDLGSDDYFELDKNDNLIVDFDGSWVAINDYIVPYYAVNDDDRYVGKVPALLNGEEVNIIIVWDGNNGKVTGAEVVNQYGNTALLHKGLKPIKENDKIEFLFDYYTYDGKYEASYSLYDPITVGKKGLEASYLEIEDETFYFYYKITDIYNNDYYTEAMILEN